MGAIQYFFSKQKQLWQRRNHRARNKHSRSHYLFCNREQKKEINTTLVRYYPELF